MRSVFDLFGQLKDIFNTVDLIAFYDKIEKIGETDG